MKLRQTKHCTVGETALPKIKTDFLRDTDKLNEFNITLKNRFQALQDQVKEETTVEDNLKEIEEALTSLCQEAMDGNQHHH
ncbi:unnamed protein product [Schistosoma mattheei]|uniref:Uncharacterized protein n=1 Tax=Schistosoma mattheei TaxID=31246 RepID=A0A183Q6S7_9TREM|nr:unnamed protein product [Schistosoma mattheei]